LGVFGLPITDDRPACRLESPDEICFGLKARMWSCLYGVELFRSAQPGTAVVVAILLQADDTREDSSNRERSS